MVVGEVIGVFWVIVLIVDMVVFFYLWIMVWIMVIGVSYYLVIKDIG